MRYLWRRFLIWWRGIKVTGESLTNDDVALNTINPEPSKYGYKWAIRSALKKAKPPAPKRCRQRDIDAECVARIKAARPPGAPKVLNDLIPQDEGS